MPSALASLDPAAFLSLEPWVWVDVESSTPTGPYPWIGGADPKVVGALSYVCKQMRGPVEATLGAVYAGRARLDDPGVAERMEDAYAEIVRMRHGLGQVVHAARRPDGRFAWGFPRDATKVNAVKYDRFKVTNGVTRQVSNGELKALDAATVGRLLGELDGTRRVGEIQQLVAGLGDAASAAERWLGLLRDMGGLVTRPRDDTRARWLAATRDRDVVHLGHAALAYRAGEQFFLVDPWLLPWLAEMPIPSYWPGLLPRPGAVLLTHDHADHVDTRLLLALPKDTPILVPDHAGATGLFFDYAGFLGALGFTRVVPLAHGQRWEFEGGFVEAVPFYGEDPCDVGLPRNCYLVCDRGRNTLLWADSGPTNDGRSALVDGVVDDLVRRHGKMDVVFSSQQQIRELRALAVYAPFCAPGTWMRDGENGDLTADYLAELVARSGARQFVSYATGGADWLPDNLPFVFAHNNPARAKAIQAHWAPLEELREKLEPTGCAWHYAWGGDVFRARRDGGTDVQAQAGALGPERLYCADRPRPEFLDRIARLF